MVVNGSIDFGNVRDRLSRVKLAQIYYLLRKWLIQELLCCGSAPRERHLSRWHQLHPSRHVELCRNHAESFHVLAPSVRCCFRLHRLPSLFHHGPIRELLV